MNRYFYSLKSFLFFSDAGKLAMKDANLQNEVKPAENRKTPIILPSRKLKTQKIFTVIGNQFVPMTSQNKPNILQKLPIDSLKKAATSVGFNFVQLPKNACISPVKVANFNKNTKIINNVPIKSVPNLRILKNAISTISNPPSTNTLRSDYIKLGPIIKLKNYSNIKILTKKDVNKQLPDLPKPSQVTLCTTSEKVHRKFYFLNHSLFFHISS